MILLIERQIVILTPPKTASDTLHRLLCAPPWHGLAVVGPHHGVVDKHFPTPPNEAFRFQRLLCVRHPLDRLVSLWHHKCRLDAYEGQGSESFARFVQRLARGQLAVWLWKTTISELVGDLAPDRLLRCESLAEDLAAAGLAVGELPRHNESFRRPWANYYRPELLDLVRPWAAADCERFGYEWPSVPGTSGTES